MKKTALFLVFDTVQNRCIVIFMVMTMAHTLINPSQMLFLLNIQCEYFSHLSVSMIHIYVYMNIHIYIYIYIYMNIYI